eukprot:scaffold2077_cov119-Cylindrotheca_fusiformis.AAC.14
MMTFQWFILLFAYLLIACSAEFHSNLTPRSVFGAHGRTHLQAKEGAKLWGKLRGGTAIEAEDGKGNDTSGDVVESDGNDMKDKGPISFLIQTNWGNSVVDQQVELKAARNRNVTSLKNSISRLLPGRPPILGLELVAEGRVLDNDLLVGELFDDDDDDDGEEKEGDMSRTLILNSVPPVDPKFATDLAPKLKAHAEDDTETLSTDELLEAYFLNQAAMSVNGQLLQNPELELTPLLRLEVQEQARRFREQLKAETPAQVWESSLAPVRKSRHTEEYRGQRFRSGKGGARTNLKKSIQHNLNIVSFRRESQGSLSSF